jgi:hypothetical protein
MVLFFDRLQRRVTEADSLLCVGLDPHPKHVNHHPILTPLDSS